MGVCVHVCMRENDNVKCISRVCFADVGPTDSGEIGCKLPKMRMSVFKQFTVKGTINLTSHVYMHMHTQSCMPACMPSDT